MVVRNLINLIYLICKIYLLKKDTILNNNVTFSTIFIEDNMVVNYIRGQAYILA